MTDVLGGRIGPLCNYYFFCVSTFLLVFIIYHITCRKLLDVYKRQPFIQPSQLETVKACFDDPSTQIATLVKPFTADNGFEALENLSLIHISGCRRCGN